MGRWWSAAPDEGDLERMPSARNLVRLLTPFTHEARPVSHELGCRIERDVELSDRARMTPAAAIAPGKRRSAS